MNPVFNRLRKGNPKTATFDLSHERKLSFDMGKLIPVMVQEVLPGDEFKVNSESFIRFSPLVSPVMHRINAYIHYFFVPNRLLCETGEWEKFITRRNGVIPHAQVGVTNIYTGSLGDYLGLPTYPNQLLATEDINLLPVAAYAKIWNDFYRNSNIQSEIDIFDVPTLLGMLGIDPLNRNYEKDYFTSALPFAQKGDPSAAQVTIDYKNVGVQSPADSIDTAIFSKANTGTLYSTNQGAGVNIQNIEEASVDVNEIRRAEAMQRVLEKLYRSGERYKDWLLSFFGVETSDGRIDQAEYLGGSKTPIIVSEVLNTTGVMGSEASPEGVPLGTMAGHAINVGKSYDCYYKSEEHGFLMAILSVLPESNYGQGLPKYWSRLTDLDYPLPEFAQLGEQAVLRKELYYDDGSPSPDGVFGYVPRYQELKYTPSTVHGQFRNSLSFWHLGRMFSNAAPPYLTSDFITADPADFTRIFAIEDLSKTEQMYCQIYHSIEAKRPLPYYSDPQIG